MKKTKRILALLFIMGWCLNSLATNSPGALNYQGRILKPDGLPLEAASVQFTIGILNPTGSCLLFEETHTINMTGSEGTFSLPLGSGTSTGATLNTISEAVSNSVNITGASACAYNPTSGDSRIIRVSVDDGLATLNLADQFIQSVPYALYATRLEGKGKSDFIQVNTTTSSLSQVNAETLFQTANYNELINLAAGTSTTYAKASDLPVTSGVLNLSGAGAGIIVADIPLASNHAVNKNYTDANVGGRKVDQTNLSGLANGESLKWDSTANSGTGGWVRYTPVAAGSTVATVSVNAPLVDAGTATAPNLSLNLGDGVLVNGSNQLTVNLGQGLEINSTAIQIKSGTGLIRDATNLRVDVGMGANQIPQMNGSGNLALSGSNLENAGYITMQGQRYLHLGAFTDAQEATMIGSLSAANSGTTWYNSTSNQIKFWNGTATQVLSTATSSISSLNGLSDSSQTFGAPGSSGTAPNWSSAASVHTLNIPLASSASVTAGLISKTDYDSFTAKQSGDPQLTDIATIDPTLSSGYLLGSNGTNLIMRTPAEARSDLALGTAATLSADSNNTFINGQLVAFDSATMTCAPGEYLTIQGPGPTFSYTCAVDQGASSFANGGNAFGADATIGTNDNFGLNFETNATTRMTILNNGNVGIGTSSPASYLTVQGAGGTTFFSLKNESGTEYLRFVKSTGTIPGRLELLNGSGTVISKMNANSSGGGLIVANGQSNNITDGYANTFGAGINIISAKVLNEENGIVFSNSVSESNPPGAAITFYTSDTSNFGRGGLKFKTTNSGSITTRMTIDPLGKVGIGTTTPSSPLDVNGDITLEGMAAPSLSPAGQGRMYFDSTSNTFKISQNGGAFADILTSASGTGDITDVVAGAGLTGGATSGSATLDIGAGAGIVVNANDVAVDVGTADGKIVQVQAGGKLPALDGSDLTNLDAGDIATGTLTIARGGTGAATANDALNALLPTQTTNSGKVLKTDGVNSSWVTPNAGTVTSVTSANSYLSVSSGTSTPLITANVGTAANTLAAGDDSRITGALQASDYNLDVGPAASCTTSQTPYWNTVSGAWACQNINFPGGGGDIANGGNTTGADITLGTNDNFGLNFETNATTRMTILNDGKVGIGTAVPAGQLHVASSGSTTMYVDAANTGTYSSLKISKAGGAYGELFSGSANPDFAVTAMNGSGDLLLGAGGTQGRVVIQSDGLVGIGTSTPTSQLHVVGAAGTAGSTTGKGVNLTAGAGYASGNGTGGGISLTGGQGTGTSPGGAINITSGAGNSSSSGGGAINILAGTGSSGGGNVLIKSSNYTSGTGGAYLSLSGSGSVGAGGISLVSGGLSGVGPGNGGDITIQTPNNNIGFTGTAGNISILAGRGAFGGAGGTVTISAGGGGSTNIDGSNVVVNGGAKGGTGTDGNVLLASVRGLVGVGITTPEAKLDVADSSTTTSAIIVPRAGNFTGTSVDGMVRYNTTSTLFEFYQNGSWVNYTTVSDGRLKTNVETINVGLEIVNQLHPVFFDWDKSNPKATSFEDKHQVGFIAQEVEKVLPEVVNQGKDSYRSVEYGKIVAVVVAAVKELYSMLLGNNEKIENIERKLASKADASDIEKLKSENQLKEKQMDDLKKQLKDSEHEVLELKLRLEKIEKLLEDK